MAVFKLVFFLIVFDIHSAVSVLPEYTPAIQADGLTRDEIIKSYFNLRFSYVEILSFLVNVHGIHLGLRQIKRILRRLGCWRRGVTSNFDDIVRVIENELKGSGSIIGYRAMHQRLTVQYGLNVTRNTVRQVLKILDPEGVNARSRHRMRRRLYTAKEPNYLWHIDGYDKLKPFGFCIHGAIDGYSRRVLWLEVANTNNDPEIIGSYFIDYVNVVGGTACITRADRGTENVHVECMQRFFRRLSQDDFAGDKSFMYGRSTSNQRIEAWWSLLRKACTDWWIRYFKDLRDQGLYNDDNVIHRECLKFCFMDILQTELHSVARDWNIHRIRPSRNAESPPGRPDVLYFNPQERINNYLVPVSTDEIDIANETCCRRPSERGCTAEFNELATMIIEDEALSMPTNWVEAKELYLALLGLIQELDENNM